MVSAKINKTQVQETIVKRNPHTESASSKMLLSLLTFISFAREDSILNESLFKNRLIIIGSIKTAKEIMPMMPEDFFIRSRLELTVLKASLTDEPTSGTKLLMANLAVLIDNESALCERVLLKDRTNIRIDITKTVTEEKVFFTVFDMPLKSNPCPAPLMHAKDKHILISGSIKTIKNPSTKFIINNIAPLIMAALEMLPLIVKSAIIIGMNDFITPHKIFKYSQVITVICWHTVNTATEMQRVEQRESILLTPAVQEERELNMLIMIINDRIAPKLLSTLSIPASKYDTLSSKRLLSSISPFIRLS